MSVLNPICKRFAAELDVVTSRSVRLLSSPSDKIWEILKYFGRDIRHR
jgi:hypothetical protein